jgi:hypothetical protein
VLNFWLVGVAPSVHLEGVLEVREVTVSRLNTAVNRPSDVSCVRIE